MNKNTPLIICFMIALGVFGAALYIAVLQVDWTETIGLLGVQNLVIFSIGIVMLSIILTLVGLVIYDQFPAHEDKLLESF